LIPLACKRIAEVDFPIAAVSRHAAREKSVRHGHPSTLHLWWARRPLASSRAMLLALLLPDPADENCPEAFRAETRAILRDLPNMGGARDNDDAKLREAILRFIGDIADWDRSDDASYLEAARALVRAAHGEAPLVVDPFAGGGSIPLEALRLGCETRASDLNPVACLILKAMLEDVPRHGPGLAAALREAGKAIKTEAEQQLARFYPPDSDGARPIAYLWARTVRCEAPDCGAEIPLVRSFWLARKGNRRQALKYHVARSSGTPPRLRFEVFSPPTETDVPRGTVSRARATCACCERVLEPERVRAQLRSQSGGADVEFDSAGQRIGGATLLAVVTLKAGDKGRRYRPATSTDYEAVYRAWKAVATLQAKPRSGGRSAIPDELLPPEGTLGFRVQKYGMATWADLFTARQKLAMHAITTKTDTINDARSVFALSLTRCADYWSSGARWVAPGEFVAGTFGRQALPMIFDFAEVAPWQHAAGGFSGALEWAVGVVEKLPSDVPSQPIVQADARHSKLSTCSASAWFTDPPYYDAIPYADLSDFFFVWLKRALPDHPLLRDPSDPANPLTPKHAEIVQDETKRHNGEPKNKQYFERPWRKRSRKGGASPATTASAVSCSRTRRLRDGRRCCQA
jgi:adenine-specific DNA methylase